MAYSMSALRQLRDKSAAAVHLAEMDDKEYAAYTNRTLDTILNNDVRRSLQAHAADAGTLLTNLSHECKQLNDDPRRPQECTLDVVDEERYRGAWAAHVSRERGSDLAPLQAALTAVRQSVQQAIAFMHAESDGDESSRSDYSSSDTPSSDDEEGSEARD